MKINEKLKENKNEAKRGKLDKKRMKGERRRMSKASPSDKQEKALKNVVMRIK